MNPPASECPFCALPPARIVHRSEHAVVIRDAFLLTRGHSLVLPRRHVGSLFALERAEPERADYWTGRDPATKRDPGTGPRPRGEPT
ncbi:MAG: HIT family protein [Pseudomonadota bacterium]